MRNDLAGSVLPAGALVLALTLPLHAPAYAQALLDHATPAPGVTVAKAPDEIVLDFMQPLADAGNDVEVRDETGKRLDKSGAHIAPDNKSRLVTPLQPLHPGAYDVIWHAASPDAPAIMGHYRFTLGGPTPAPAAAPAPQTAKAAPEAPVTITELWARATPPGASTGVVYLTLSSKADDKLTAVSSTASADAAVHEMTMASGIMRMNAMTNGVDLPAGKTVAMIPGGMHVMLTNLKAPLKAGDDVPLHLVFQHAPPMDVKVPVQPIAATHETPHEMGRNGGHEMGHEMGNEPSHETEHH